MLNFLFEIVSMSIMASFIFVIVSIFKPLTEKKCTTKWQLNLLKVTLIVFVFPISKMIERLIDIIGMEEVIQQIPKIAIETQNHVVSNAPTVQKVQTITSNISIINTLLLIWTLGAVVSFVWMWYCRKRFLNNIFKHCEKTTDINTIKVFNKCKALFEVTAKVEVIESEYVKTPMLIGVLSPKILLPKQKQTAEHLEYILSHELIHLKRKDLLWKNILLAVRIIHWFNPLVYLFAIEFDKYIEYLCDELVVEQLNHSERKNYGFAILESMYMKTTPTYSSVGVGFATTELKIERRLTNMLNSKKMKKSSKIMSMLMVSAIVVTMAIPVFAQEETPVLPTAEHSENSYFIKGEDGVEIPFSGEINNAEKISLDDLPSGSWFISKEDFKKQEEQIIPLPIFTDEERAQIISDIEAGEFEEMDRDLGDNVSVSITDGEGNVIPVDEDTKVYIRKDMK